MPSHYSIVQYVPDPITDERINVGVIATGEGGTVRVRFLSHWQRVHQFGLANVSFLQDFARVIEMRQDELDLAQAEWTEPVLRKLSADWVRSVQFTEPRASLKDVNSLFEEIVVRFLHDVGPAAVSYRRRREARDLTARAVKDALRRRFGYAAGSLVKTRFALRGESNAAHHFDVVAANGHALFAAQTLSLEGPDQRGIEIDISAAGWSLRDVKQLQANFSTAIIALMPPEPILESVQMENIERLRAVSAAIGVPTITEQDIPRWAEEAAARVPLQ
jgi:hypothetical protein